MNLQEFADQFRIRPPHADECGDLNIVGKRGDIYVYDDKLFCCTILRAPTSQHWNKYREQAVGMGLKVTQNGDAEGTFLFDPAVTIEANFAIEAIQPHFKRQASPAQLENLKQSIETRRENARKARLAQKVKRESGHPSNSGRSSGD